MAYREDIIIYSKAFDFKNTTKLVSNINKNMLECVFSIFNNTYSLNDIL